MHLFPLSEAPEGHPHTVCGFKQMLGTSLRNMRIVHVILLAAIAGYAYVAEMTLNPTTDAPPILVKAFAIMAVVEVVITFAIRRKLLRSAMEGLQRDAGDVTALAQWRKANLFSMVMGVSVALYGLALRLVGGSRRVAAPYFVAAVILMMLWGPRLDEVTSGANPSPPPIN